MFNCDHKLFIRTKEHSNRPIWLEGISILLYIRLSYNNHSHILNFCMPSILHILSHLILQRPLWDIITLILQKRLMIWEIKWHAQWHHIASKLQNRDLHPGPSENRSVNCHTLFQWNLTYPWQNQLMKHLNAKRELELHFGELRQSSLIC